MDATRWPDRFLGGAVCLDFINTIERPGTRQEEDRFSGYNSILDWSMSRGTLPSAAIAQLRDKAQIKPASARQAWLTAIALRQVLRDLMMAMMAGRPSEAARERFNRYLADLPPVPPVVFRAEGFRHRLSGGTLEEPLWPVLWSAAGLLAENQIARLGQCQAENCRYFFLDLSRNLSRRWCSSDICGNRERVRRAYRAEKVETGSSL